MTQFNISNSKIEQLNDKGNNYKLVNESGNNAVTEKGDITQGASGQAIKARLFLDEIDSFSKIREVSPDVVAPLLNNGYLDMSEDAVQHALEQILAVSFHKKDWGGEVNDLYTPNVLVDGTRRATAFLLKGNGLQKKTMEIKNCGANGDQVVRLFQSPADLFVIQFVGNISEAVIHHTESEVARLKAQGRHVQFVTIDGQDTARLLYAYGKLPTQTPLALPSAKSKTRRPPA